MTCLVCQPLLETPDIRNCGVCTTPLDCSREIRLQTKVSIGKEVEGSSFEMTDIRTQVGNLLQRLNESDDVYVVRKLIFM